MPFFFSRCSQLSAISKAQWQASVGTWKQCSWPYLQCQRYGVLNTHYTHVCASFDLICTVVPRAGQKGFFLRSVAIVCIKISLVLGNGVYFKAITSYLFVVLSKPLIRSWLVVWLSTTSVGQLLEEVHKRTSRSLYCKVEAPFVSLSCSAHWFAGLARRGWVGTLHKDSLEKAWSRNFLHQRCELVVCQSLLKIYTSHV